MAWVYFLFVGSFVCLLLGISWVAFDRWRMPVENSAPPPFNPDPVIAPAMTVPPIPTYQPLPVASNPVDVNDLALMLRAGLGDREVIEAIAGRQLVSLIDGVAVDRLRQLGAGQELIRYLQRLALHGRSVGNWVPGNGGASEGITLKVPLQAHSPAFVAQPEAAAPVAAPQTLVEPAQRDQEIAALKKQVDELDEQVRRARVNPKSNPMWPLYYGDQCGGIDQLRYKDYVDRLDQQRNDLRRRKWQLEGR